MLYASQPVRLYQRERKKERKKKEEEEEIGKVSE